MLDYNKWYSLEDILKKLEPKYMLVRRICCTSDEEVSEEGIVFDDYHQYIEALINLLSEIDMYNSELTDEFEGKYYVSSNKFEATYVSTGDHNRDYLELIIGYGSIKNDGMAKLHDINNLCFTVYPNQS